MRISPCRSERESLESDLSDKRRTCAETTRGQNSPHGIESTVIDLSVSPPKVLRPGMIHDEALLAVTGELSVASERGPQVLKSPGQLPRHYAPKADLTVLSWADETDLQQKLVTNHESRITKHESRITRHESRSTYIIAHTHIPSSTGFAGVSVIPHDPEAFARALYAELHRCDEAGAELIVVEALPETNEWRAIADRLKRAAAK